MRKKNLWLRGLLSTGLGLSIFLSSFGNVSGALAAEPAQEEIVLESQDQSGTGEDDKSGESSFDEGAEENGEKISSL